MPNGQGAPGRESLAANFAPTADKSDVEPLSEASKTALKAKGVVFPNPKRPFQGGKTMSTHFQILASYTTNKDASYLRPFTLCLPQEEVEEVERDNQIREDNITVNGLIDSGAVHSS